MDLAAEAAFEEPHDQLVLGDAAHAAELLADDAGAEVDVIGALDERLGTGYPGLDDLLQLG